MACFSYTEDWYNPVRLHSGLSYRSPMAYEVTMQTAEAIPSPNPQPSMNSGNPERLRLHADEFARSSLRPALQLYRRGHGSAPQAGVSSFLPADPSALIRPASTPPAAF